MVCNASVTVGAGRSLRLARTAHTGDSVIRYLLGVLTGLILGATPRLYAQLSEVTTPLDPFGNGGTFTVLGIDQDDDHRTFDPWFCRDPQGFAFDGPAIDLPYFVRRYRNGLMIGQGEGLLNADIYGKHHRTRGGPDFTDDAGGG